MNAETAMTYSAPVTHVRRTRWWRSGISHTVALVAGVALAMALTPRATQFINPPLAVPRAATSEFDRALQAVMLQMDAAMCVTPSADADRDFARAMIPHHQGAVEMARLELLYGHDPRLRRLAQGMVVEQSQEIALMRSILASASTVSGADLGP
jgi:ABC-type histidine transport system ATPase subunit